LSHIPLYFFSLTWPDQLAHISTNSTGLEVNDHVSLQWPSYEQSQGSNLKPQREQTSWSQVFTTGPPPRWLIFHYIISCDYGNVNKKKKKVNALWNLKNWTVICHIINVMLLGHLGKYHFYGLFRSYAKK